MIPVSALTAFAAETTTITSVTATSDVGQPVYGARVPGQNTTVFTITSGSPASTSNGAWHKWDGSKWQQMTSGTFTEGTWRYEVQVREDSADYVLSNSATFTVNGIEWTPESGSYYDGSILAYKHSYQWYTSPEYTVTAPVLEYYNVTLNSGTGYTVEAVTGSESPVVAGGSFTFKVTINSGYEEGSKFKVKVNGTPVTLDGEGKYTITNINEAQNVTVDGVIAKRTAIDSIVATTTFNPVYGATVADPTFNVTTGAPATFNTDNNQGAWYKWNGSDWERVTSGTFTVGRWRYQVQIRTDSTTHKLGESVTVTVNGNAWIKDGSVAYGDSFSYVNFVSPEFTVENPNAREITFAANGGGSTMASVIVEAGDTYELPACGFTAPAQGQEFKYWDVDGARKNPGDVITITDNTTVKAVWGLKEYTVNFTGDTAYYSEDDDDNKATHGQNYVVKFTPVDGYEIDNSNLVIHSGSSNLMNIPGSWDFDDATDTLTIVGTYVTGDLTIRVTPDKIPGKFNVTWTNGTGYQITAAEGYSSPVTEGNDFHFVVTLGGNYKEGANFKVKANGVELTKVGGGYVIENITANQEITVEGVVDKPTYTVTLPTGTGYTSAPAGTFTTTVVEGNNFSFVVTLGGNYREGANFKVKANGVELTKVGGGYTIENITANQVITVEGVEELPKYTVTWNDGTGYQITAATGYTSPVYEGEDFHFVVTLGGDYKEGANYKVKANGNELTKVGGGYAIENITANTVITVEDVIAKPTYTVTLPTGTGFTAVPAATFTTTVVEGNDFSFVVSVVGNYREGANFKVKANGVELTKVSGGYTIENITANQVITVEGVEELPKYTVTWNDGTGYQITAATGYTSPVYEGQDFHFVVTLGGNYQEGANYKVKANGVELTKTSGYYAITNVTANQVITVEGVEELPKYTVTWNDGTGYQITAATGYTSPVYEGEDFHFVVTLGGNYKEGANYKVKANGVELTKIGGGYVIENITANTVITVEDVIAKPTYTVTLPTGTGFTAVPAATFTTTVVEGNDFSFVVSVVGNYREGANFKVKANGVEIVKSGDLYTIQNITANQVITVEGVEELPKYTVTWNDGTGYQITAATGYTSPVYEGGDFRFVVTLGGDYKEGANYKVKANGVELTKVGGGYAIENITANTVITVEDVIAKPTYTVTLPTGTGFTAVPAATFTTTVVEGNEFSFVVSVVGNYREGANFKVKANGVEIVKSGDLYTIQNITANQVITVEGVEALPEYTITLPTGTGFTSTVAAGYTTNVVEGKDFHFVVSVTGNYREGANFKVKANGVELTKTSGYYAITNVTANQVITVEGVEELPKYSVTWTDGTGYMITASTGYTSPVYEGEDFRFVVTLGGNYKEGANYKVKANGVELTKVGGGYAIENITTNTVITVEDVIAKPTYTVTLPTGTGFTSAPAATFTTTIVEGNDFSFVVSVVDGYRATADFKVKANGVEIAKVGDLYVIDNVTANTVITVEGVEQIPANDDNNGNTGNNGGNTDNKPSDNPQTGDNSMMWLWVALLFVSGFGVVGTTVVRKKKTSVK